jgi:hypothetical protein
MSDFVGYLLHTSKPLGSTRFKTLFQEIIGEVAADKYQPTFTLLASLPRPLMVAFDQHVYALDDEALAEILSDVLDPGNEALGIHGPVTGQRPAGDPLVMLVVGELVEKLGLDFEDAIEIESVPAEHIAEINVTACRGYETDEA